MTVIFLMSIDATYVPVYHRGRGGEDRGGRGAGVA